MKARSTAICLVVGLVAAAVLVAPNAAAAKKKKKAPTSLVVGVDKADDWGCGVDCTINPLGNQLGQELLKATIGVANRTTLNFIIQVKGLPPTGGVPEFSRYTWEFTVNGNATQLSGGFTEFIRGVCNPTYNPAKCPPPRNPGQSPFFIRRGGCTLGVPPGPCEEIGLANATFDAAKGTITIPVPMKVIGAKPGSKIGPGASLFGDAIYSAPAAFVINASMPSDTIAVTKTFIIPRR